MKNLLRIGIPTRAASSKFITIIRELDRQVCEVCEKYQSWSLVSIAVHVNGEDGFYYLDALKSIARESKYEFEIFVRPENIGFDGNYLGLLKNQCDYTWVIGDDDQICDGVLPVIVETLIEHQPDYLYVGGYTQKTTVKNILETKKLSELLEYVEFRVGGIAASIFGRTCLEIFWVEGKEKDWAFWPHLGVLFSTINHKVSYIALAEKGFVELDTAKRWINETGRKEINSALWAATDMSQYSANNESKIAQKIIDRHIFSRIWWRVFKSIIKGESSFDIAMLTKVYWR
ncbi:hypothetical protein [Litorivivens sp.]|uniref:hypothetical protein n=1 Tax=Litorivivens sp. TaxID=2020868 RepID=UPI0035656B2C